MTCGQLESRKRKLKANGKTRWNTTYSMLKSCEDYGYDINHYFNIQPKDPESDWKVESF